MITPRVSKGSAAARRPCYQPASTVVALCATIILNRPAPSNATEPSPSSPLNIGIAIVAANARAPLVVRLRAELLAVGLYSAVVERAAPPTPAQLVAIADGVRAVAAVCLYPRSGAEVWIVERDKTLARPLDHLGPITRRADPSVTLRTAETLRAQLLLRLPQLRLEAAKRGRRNAPARPHRWWLEAAAGPVFAPGGSLSASGNLDLALGWLAGPRWGLQLGAWLPLAPAQVIGPEGEGRLHVGMLTVGAELQLARQQARWLPRLGAGIGLAITRMQGQAIPPFRDGSEWALAFVSYTRAALSLRMTAHWRLFARVSALLAIPRPVVSFAGRRVGAWGRPALATTLGVTYRI